MAAKKKPSIKDRFITIRTPAENKKGYRDRSVYAGPWVRWKVDGAIPRVLFLTLGQLLLMIPGIARFFPVNWALSVTTFGLLSLLPSLMQLMGVIRLLLSRKQRFMVMDLDSMNWGLRTMPLWSCILLGLTALSQILWLIFHFHALSLIAPLCTLGAAILAVLARASYLTLTTEQQPNEVKRGLKEIIDKSTGLGTGIYTEKKRKS